MNSASVLLTVQDLTIGFGQADPVVDQLSFRLKPGKTLALVGESGSGKSMTALSLLGLLPGNARIRTGKVEYFQQATSSGLDLTNLTEPEFRPIRSREIGMIFQEPLTALNPITRIGKQIEESIRFGLGEKDKTSIKAKALHWLEKVQLQDPERIMRAYPYELSGGQRQRVLIAMAMLAGPKLLIADEPTTALDTVTEAAILRLLRELTTENDTALLFISHDLAVVRHLADEVILLRQGKMVEQGATETIFTNPQEAYTQELIQLSPRLNFTRTAAQNNAVNTDSTAILLEAEGLSVTYPLKRNWLGRPTVFLQAVKNVNLSIRKGEFIGLIGESGCGKSSLIRALTGLTPLSSGTIKPRGLNIQLVFQDPFSSLNPVLGIGAVVKEVVDRHYPECSRIERREKAENLLHSVELDPSEYYDRLPEEMSGGQRQRLAIARALAAKPDLLICDEAVSALDAALQKGIMNLLADLTRNTELPILFISHDLALVSTVVDRVLVMDAGEIVERDSPKNLLKRPVSAASRKLLSAILPV